MNRVARKRVVAIDGPAGSGKSTVARGVAGALGLEVLDTGAMYRAVTLLALEHGLDLADGPAIAASARTVRLELGSPPGSVTLDGRDVSDEIRGPVVAAAVSQVSAHPEVRALLVDRQRRWVDDHGGGVVEGRDIGTVVFPEAPLKVFLMAAPEERAKRRALDEAAADRPADAHEVEQAIARRDRLDSSRSTSPLRPADDALVIDTTGRNADTVVDEIVERFRATAGAER
jgi:cytidylate kinase